MTLKNTPHGHLSLGSHGEEVVVLHRYLQQFGYFPNSKLKQFGSWQPSLTEAPNDLELFDERTQAAIIAFQRAHGLPDTGVLDDATSILMRQPRCGVPDPVSANFLTSGTRWKKFDLTFRIERYTSALSKHEVESAITSALARWKAATPLHFSKVSKKADIRIGWYRGDHGDGNAFDGTSGILAHAFYPPPNGGEIAGDIHFDESEPWTTVTPPSGIDLLTVALHEAGHALGLEHSKDPNAVMYAYYSGIRRELAPDDIRRIQSLYGAPLMPITASLLHRNGKAYFFRGDRYQRFDFDKDEVDKIGRIGIDGWKGVWNNGIDAAITHPNGNAYLFLGDRYQRFNFDKDKVDKTGRIGVDGWKGVWSSGIDAAVNHPNGRAYFFRGNQYQRFNFAENKVDKTGRIGVDGWKGLWDNGIDAATTHPNGKAYFFRSDRYLRFDFKKNKVDKTGRTGVDGWRGLHPS